MTKLTLETIKRRLRKFQPRTPQDVLRKCQFPLVFVDEGSFRVVYHIVGTEYVIKVPLQEWEAYCWSGPRSKWIKKHINHARLEMNAHTIISTSTRPEMKELVRYLPEMPSMNWETGVTLMRKYRRPTGAEWRKHSTNLFVLIAQIQSHNTDIKPSNCGVDSNGNMKILDLGCMELKRK